MDVSERDQVNPQPSENGSASPTVRRKSTPFVSISNLLSTQSQQQELLFEFNLDIPSPIEMPQIQHSYQSVPTETSVQHQPQNDKLEKDNRIPVGPETASIAAKEHRSIRRSVRRNVVLKVAVVLLALSRAALAIAVMAALSDTNITGTWFPGNDIAAVTWSVVAFTFISAIAFNGNEPLSSSSQSATSMTFAVALAAIMGAPIDLRLLWIECADKNQTDSKTDPISPFCTHPTAGIASALGHLISLLMLATSKSLLNEHRFRSWLISEKKSSPEPSASFWSKATFAWFDDTITLGFDRPLEKDDAIQLIESDTSETVLKEFRRSQNHSWSLLRNLIWFAFPLLIVQAIFSIISAFLVLASPFLLREILKFAQDPSTFSNPSTALFCALLLFLGIVIRSIADSQMYFLGRRIGLRLRAIIIMLVYKKSLKCISKSSPTSNEQQDITPKNKKGGSSSGKITNLMSYDAFKVLEASSQIMYLWMTPIEVVICTAFLVTITGASGLAGTLVMALIVPISARIGQLVSTYQKQLMSTSDLRVTAINELLQGIQIVKMFAWEPHFVERIRKIRETELGRLWNYVYTSAASRLCWAATPILVSFMTFFSMSLILKQSLDAATVFTALALFKALKMPLTTFPDIIVKINEALVSLRRIESYLNEPEITPPINHNVQTAGSIQISQNASFSWYRPSGTSPSPNLRIDESPIEFPQGGLTVIVGPTGSGKTSLLMALLGELHTISGNTHLGNPQGHGDQHESIALVSQQTWLQNATIRDNILFGSPFDPVRYIDVLRACALITDLQVLPGGDTTEVGEKGVNLSGGQKARISLARACYSHASMVLLDDPLSAVDAPTARQLFAECICGPILADRTRILVTHAESLCVPKANLVIRVVGGVTSIESVQSHTKYSSKSNSLVEINAEPSIMPFQASQDKRVVESEKLLQQISSSNGSSARITTTEARTHGSVSLSVYWSYIQAAGGMFYLVIVAACYIAAQAVLVCYDLWLKVWSDAYYAIQTNPDNTTSTTPQDTSSVDIQYYVSIYALLGLTSIVFLLIRVTSLAIGSIRASRQIHSTLITKIMRVPIQFFEKTPMGRIVNRLTKDMKDIDQEMAFYFGDFFGNVITTVSALFVIFVVTPGTVMGILPVTVGYAVLGIMYRRTSRELKRLDAMSRSPVFSHFGETIAGASTIRAYAAQDRFVREAYNRLDNNHSKFLSLWISNLWLGIRVDLSGALVTLASSVAIVTSVAFHGGINPGLAGLSLSYALSFLESLLWLIRVHAQMEMEIVAVERAQEYMAMEEEAPAVIPSSRPPSDWPTRGNIVVKDLTVRHSPDALPVLDRISFVAHAGEKIAIVGRTGAGKTTLTLAFFRFLEHDSGSIVIDDVDISRIGLHDLRSRLCIIPQTPVLFSGTLRSNMDPFERHTDSDIWNALKQSQFLDTIETGSTSTSDVVSGEQYSATYLDMPITEGGSNFSQGQRQLLCLSRALLQSSRIIILDEATASIDHATDTRIQHTIRKEFKGSTLLTIAHRLHTVIDYDKVLVMDHGHVVQFGTPYELMNQDGNIFHQMCVETGDFDKLVSIAQTHALRNTV